MSIDPHPGMIRFNGYPSVFFMAICRDCDIATVFETEAAREVWIMGHRTTNHTINVAVDIRPDPKIPFAFVTRETLQQHQRWQSQPWSSRDSLLAQQTDDQTMPPHGNYPRPDSGPREGFRINRTFDEAFALIDEMRKNNTTPPKKPNARDRRRARRAGKQWKKNDAS